MLRWLACLLLCTASCWLTPTRGRADDAALLLDSAALSGRDLAPFSDVLEDPTGALTLAELRAAGNAARFQRSHPADLGFGLTRSAFWLRFTLRVSGQASLPFLLELGNPALDDVQLYAPTDAGSHELHRTGDHLPFDRREVAHRTYLFSLYQAPGPATYYLRVQSTSALSVPLRVWSAQRLLEHQSTEQPLLWFFYGLMLVMAVYNLFSYVSLRETAYLYCVAYILSAIGLQLSLDGFAYQYLWPDAPSWNGKAPSIWLYFGIGSGLLFQRDFLQLWQDFPRLARVSRALGTLSFALAAGALSWPDALGLHVLVCWAVSSGLFILVVSVLAATTRSREAVYYAVSWAALLTGIAPYLMRSLGVLGESFWSAWGPQLGAASEVTLLSLGLADRVHFMRENLRRLNSRLTQNVDRLTAALERAQAATRARNELVASVSQALRTPLNAILGLPEGLLEDFHEVPALACGHCHAIFALEPGDEEDPDQPCPECHARQSLAPRRSWVYAGNPEQAVRQLGSIHKASKHLMNVVSAILDFSKLEADRVQLALGPVDLPQLLEDSVSPLRRLAEARGTSLTLLPGHDDCSLQGDAVRIAQVVVNLVGNAIKFSDGAGEVTVWATADADSCEIHVRDRGIGIAPADQQRIFEDFSPLESGPTRRFAGAGLGLSISKRLVELHGGRIWVESELGTGSTFHVRLPKAGPTPSEPAPPRISTRVPRAALTQSSAETRRNIQL